MNDLERVKSLLEDALIRTSKIFYERHNRTGGLPDMEADIIKGIVEGIECLFIDAGGTSEEALEIKGQMPSVVAIQAALRKVYNNGHR